ncbi:MAG: nucleoside phosphorylase [Bacteroidales bacterium]|jgi:uridine phosphorylase|nr:nucleoside phosphorylase [Bacteroidales bacterium]
MRIPESELIINADGSAFHIHMRPEDLADIVVVFGDPGRVKMFESLFDTIEVKGQSREFAFATGTYNGKRVTALSHGIGCDNIDIVMTELDALANIDFKTREVKPEHKTLTIVRIGTCGAIQPDIPLGSFILSHISVGCDGLMNWYEGRDQIALLDFEEAFKKAVKWNKHLPDPYFVRGSERLIELFKDCTVKGMTVSASGFYGPQGRVVRQGLAMPDMLEDFEKFEHKGYRITNFEMEGSALAGMAAKLGHDAITVCCAIAHRYLKDANTDYKPRVNELVELVLKKLTA